MFSLCLQGGIFLGLSEFLASSDESDSISPICRSFKWLLTQILGLSVVGLGAIKLRRGLMGFRWGWGWFAGTFLRETVVLFSGAVPARKNSSLGKDYHATIALVGWRCFGAAFFLKLKIVPLI